MNYFKLITIALLLSLKAYCAEFVPTEFETKLHTEFVEIGIPGLQEIVKSPKGYITKAFQKDGESYYIKIESIEFVNGGYDVSYYKSKQKIRLEPSEDKKAPIAAETIPDGEGSDQGQAIGGIDSALIGAGISTLQYALVAALPYHKQIETIYRAISELDQQIENHKDNIRKVRISLQEEAIKLDLVLKKSVNEITLPPIDIADLDKISVSTSAINSRLKTHTWLSQDGSFREQAEFIRETLTSAKIESNLDQFFYDFGKEALLRADYKSSIFHKVESQVYLEFAQFSADVLLGIDPFTGLARSLYEFVSGTNVITGKELSVTERVFAGLGVFTAGYAVKALKLYKLLTPLAKLIGKTTFSAYKGVIRFLDWTGHTGFKLGTSSQIRQINFKSAINSKWGLTKKHLHKHFFSKTGNHSLVNIDPSGNPDLWMQYMMDLVQRPPTRIKPDGVIEILGSFPKQGTNDFFDMGVRLMPLDDKSFDLITVLTRQN